MHHKITKYISASVKCVTLFIASKTAVRDSVDLVCIKGPWRFSDLGQFCALPFCHTHMLKTASVCFGTCPKSVSFYAYLILSASSLSYSFTCSVQKIHPQTAVETNAGVFAVKHHLEKDVL